MFCVDDLDSNLSRCWICSVKVPLITEAEELIYQNQAWFRILITGRGRIRNSVTGIVGFIVEFNLCGVIEKYHSPRRPF